MRVLIVVHGFPPAAQGGSEIYAFEHARTLRRVYGDVVFVLTREADVNRPEFAIRREERAGLSIAWINNTFRTVRRFEETYRNDHIHAIAAEEIDRFKPDVAHIHHLTCLSTTIVDLLAKRRIPCVLTLHDYWLLCHRGQLLDVDNQVCDGPEPSGCRNCLGTAAGMPLAASMAAPLVRAIEGLVPGEAGRRFAASSRRVAAMFAQPAETVAQSRLRFDHMKEITERVTHFVAPSQYMHDRFVRFGVAPSRISVSSYGFDHSPFGGVGTSSSSTLRLGFLGTLMVSKGPHVLLDAFRNLPAGAASVDVIGEYVPYHGDDTYRERMAPLLKRPGVTLHPPVSHDRVADVLGAIDVLVVPSIWPENSPLVIREAFLAGVPVVASRIGGIPEIVSDGNNGLLFQAGDVADLTRVLKRLLDEPELIGTLRAGLPPVRTIEDDVRSTRDLYDRMRREGDSVRRMAAIVLNYGTPDDTLLAVRSLLASRRPLQMVIVVDNSASEDCRTALASVLSRVTYVRTARNLGFSGGMNVGVRRALADGADYIVMVNSDMIVPPDCLDRMEACLERMPHAGIVGPAVLSRSDPARVATLGMSYVPSSGRMRNIATGAEFASVRTIGDALVDGVSGCLMLVKRGVFDTIGLLDEDYFFSFEDLDFCLKARRAGFATVVAADAIAYHEGSRSIGPGSPDRLDFGARNQLLMADRATLEPRRLRSAFRFSSIVMLNVAHAVLSPGGTMPARLLAVARGTRDYLGRKFGDRPRR